LDDGEEDDDIYDEVEIITPNEKVP